MTERISRRAILAAGVSPLVANAADRSPTKPSPAKVKPFPSVSEFVRLIDPVTESPVIRLTSPSSASYLPVAGNRFISLRERFLLFSSDRTGVATPFHVDLRTGALRPLTATTNLLPRSLCLDASGRLVYLIDGTSLKQLSLNSKKVEVLADGVSAFSVGSSAAELLVVREGRLELLNSKAASALAENVAPWCALRPGGGGCAFGRLTSSQFGSGPGADPNEQEFWYLPLRSPGARPVLLAQGKVSNPLWSPDGRSLLFLRQTPVNGTLVTEIHAASPEKGVEERVAPTSQFAAFAPNGDGSVFVGASASRAQPTVILLLRSTQREFTLCEHRATHPVSVSPVFSPDSRRVYFESDHQGKSALYSVNIEHLVEPTTPSTG